MKRIMFIGAASAAALVGSIALAAPAMASNGNGPTAVTHLNHHPDTTGFTAGAIVNNVWAYDNATEKFTVVAEGGNQYLVTMDYVGSFHGFADPRLETEGGDPLNLGAALDSNGSVKGTIAYDVTAAKGPDLANLPGQSPSGAHIADNINLLFDGSATAINQHGPYTFTYHKVAGADYTQAG